MKDMIRLNKNSSIISMPGAHGIRRADINCFFFKGAIDGS